MDKNIHYKNTLPLLVPVLRHVPQPVEELLGLLEEVAELVDDLPLLLLLHVLVHCVRYFQLTQLMCIFLTCFFLLLL